jgi:hypothetical protein
MPRRSSRPTISSEPALPNELPLPGKPPVVFLDSHQAAEFLRLSPRTLEKQRVAGGGPRFMKLGRRVVYKMADLESWANDRTCYSTSDSNYNDLA